MGRGIALGWASVPYACWALPLAQTTRLPLLLTHRPNCVVGSHLPYCICSSSLFRLLVAVAAPWVFLAFDVWFTSEFEKPLIYYLLCEKVQLWVYRDGVVLTSPPCWSRGGVSHFCCCAVHQGSLPRGFWVILPLPSVFWSARIMLCYTHVLSHLGFCLVRSIKLRSLPFKPSLCPSPHPSFF